MKRAKAEHQENNRNALPLKEILQFSISIEFDIF
jgi:hypothetical protein